MSMTSRKQFILSQIATCKNLTSSWSLVNHGKKVVIYGAWDVNTNRNSTLIFTDEWDRATGNGRRSAAFKQSREHIRLIEEEAYTLQTFPLIYSGVYKDKNGVGPAKIAGFIPKLDQKNLVRVDNKWYA